MAWHFRFLVERTGPDAYAMTLEDIPVLTFFEDGAWARVEPASRGTFAMRDVDVIRWGAPLGVSPRGIVCLHGAAVRTAEGVVILLGTGGAGKSTLARTLASAGAVVVSDDLVRVDEHGRVDVRAEPVVRGWAEEAARQPDRVAYADLAERIAAGPGEWVPVVRVALLGERLAPTTDLDMAMDDMPVATPSFAMKSLGGREAFVAISEHRFGGHPSSRAWPAQLRAVGHIADRVPVVELSVPEGLDLLAEAAPAILGALSTVAEPNAA